MTQNILILGGTTEATALGQALAETDLHATLSLAGRVARPKRQPLPQRVGGFGGVAGLMEYLRTHAITHLVDATHPFAAQMSTHAIEACRKTNVRLVALTRPAWTAQSGDRWTRVVDISGAVRALDRPAMRVMLAVGRTHLAEFVTQSQHHYLLRLIDPPDHRLPLPNTDIIVDRGPFDQASDQVLMCDHAIEVVVSKNSGGSGAYAKIAAARTLGLEVIMIDRPSLPARLEMTSVADVMGWLHQTPSGTERGV
ncbi:MAG: cobalt-precorrin-6A reductase [Marinovum sp.]|nr:cobalt-precorrin-6A reductase [Marinovum sp.]